MDLGRVNAAGPVFRQAEPSVVDDDRAGADVAEGSDDDSDLVRVGRHGVLDAVLLPTRPHRDGPLPVRAPVRLAAPLERDHGTVVPTLPRPRPHPEHEALAAAVGLERDALEYCRLAALHDVDQLPRGAVGARQLGLDDLHLAAGHAVALPAVRGMSQPSIGIPGLLHLRGRLVEAGIDEQVLALRGEQQAAGSAGDDDPFAAAPGKAILPGRRRPGLAEARPGQAGRAQEHPQLSATAWTHGNPPQEIALEAHHTVGICRPEPV